MKHIVILFMSLFIAFGSKAQENKREYTTEEQEMISLSKSKWDLMYEKNVEN